MKRTLRPLRFIAETFLALAIVILLGLGLLVWRLEQKPISLNTALPEIQSVLAQQFSGLTFSIGKGSLRSLREYNAIGLRLENVTVFNTDGKAVGNLQEVKLGFTWKSLLSFSLMPGAIEINHPTINVTRFENGYIGFSFHEKPEQPPEEAQASSISLDRIADFLRTAPRALRIIRVRDAWLKYDNLEYGYQVVAKNGLLNFRRRREALSGIMSVQIKSGDFDQKIQGIITDDAEAQQTKVIIGLKALDVRRLPVLHNMVPEDARIDMPVSVLFTGVIDRQFKPVGATVQIASKGGNVTYAPFYPEALNVTDMAVTAHYHAAQDRLDIPHATFRLDDSSVDVSASVQDVFAHMRKTVAEELRPAARIQLKALVQNVPVDRLSTYWPQTVGQNARDWVTAQIRDGVAEKATMMMQGSIDSQQQFQLDALNGTIGFSDVTVDYLPPMPPVKGVNGVAEYDSTRFVIKAQSGKLFDTDVSDADIRITDLDKEDALIAIDLAMQGPIRDAIDVLSSKPLEYSQAMGVRPEQFDGTGDTQLSLAFPLVLDLSLDDVAMKAKSTLTDIVARDVIKDLDVAGSNMELDVDTSRLHLIGKGSVAGGAADLEWTEYFSDTAPITTDIKAKGAVTQQALKDLHVPVDNYFIGAAQADIALVQNNDKSVQVNVSADLTPVTITIPEINVQKKAGVSGKSSLVVVNTADNITTLSDVNFAWAGFSVKDANMRFNAQQDIESAMVKGLRAGRTRADIIVSPDKDNARRIVISGQSLDLSGFWSAPDKNKTNTPETKSTARNNISLRTQTLYLDPEIPLNSVKADIALRGTSVLQGQIVANTDREGTLFLQKIARKEGGQSFTLRMENAGRVLQALDVTDSMRRGVMMVTAQSTKEEPDVLKGRMIVSQFTLIKAPILARLLNAFSPVGLLRLLNQRGLTFQQVSSRVIMTDLQKIQFQKGRVSGDSLGMSFSGTVDVQTDKMDLDGTLVPVDGLNKFVGRIPLIGQTLTGLKGDGLIGATYSIKGTTEDPDVFVNPLSVLTPGILRSIFFESGQD